MCLVLAAVGVVAGHPLVLLANRDEHYDRAAEAPRDRGPAQPGGPRVWCGTDLRAGGTWIGVNDAGVVAALTNRPGAQDPSRPSRGGIPLAALACRSARDGALRAADEGARLAPNPFSLFVADRTGAWFVAWDGAGDPRVAPLAPGLRTHTNLHDLDRLPAATVLAAEGYAADAIHRAGTVDEAVSILRRVASSHAPLDGTRMANCVHAGFRGTVSSALIALPGDGPARYLHAQGAPCGADYVPVA